MPDALQLHQLVAIEMPARKAGHVAITEAHKTLLKGNLFDGLTRTYQTKEDLPPGSRNADQFPDENLPVQESVADLLRVIVASHIRMYDVVLTKETGNTHAVASVVVDGVTLIEDAPVTYLLFLEKQLIDLHTLISKLPVLPPTEVWTLDENLGLFHSEPQQTFKMIKVPASYIAVAATDKHPAQATMFQEDVSIGTWTTTKLSSRISRITQRMLISRVERLATAVKLARESANTVTQEDLHAGAAILGYVFGAEVVLP